MDRRTFLETSAAALLTSATRLKPVSGDSGAAYLNNRAPLRPLAFIPLPVRCFQPGGWIRMALERQRDGMFGHLGEISAWLVKENNAWLSPEGKGENGFEEVPYWLRGYSRIGYLLNDAAMIRESWLWIDAVLRSHRPDGNFGPLEPVGDRLWANALMLQVVRYWYEYSGDARVIPFLGRYFQWMSTFREDQFLKGYWESSRGGDLLESVYWLYHRTGDAVLLNLAKIIDRHTTNWRSKGSLPSWHAVNVGECFREPAIFYLESGNKADLDASYANFRLVRDLYGQVPGGMFGADENAREGHADPHQAMELDGMIEQIASNGSMLAITGDPMWAENSEGVAYNSLSAAFTPDYRALRYLTAPNMVVSNARNHAPGVDNSGPFFLMNPLSHRCCQHNQGSAWANFVESSWMATPDHGLVAQLYVDGALRASAGVDSAEVVLETRTKYPFDELIDIYVTSSKTVTFPLWLRIPSWATGHEIRINGKLQSVKSDGYARILRAWVPGDRVTLKLPMRVAVRRWVKNKNAASVNYGPLTFSLKIEEQYERVDSSSTALPDSRWQKNLDVSKWPALEIHPGSDWNYGLVLPEENPAKAFTVVQKPWPADGDPFTNANAPIELKVQGKQVSQWKLDENGLCGELPRSPVVTDQPAVDLTLVPMGGARLRISAFPVVS